METLHIDTFQNIDIEQPIASVAERIVATILDLLFMSGYLVIMSLLSNVLHLSALMIVGVLPVLFYSLISELAMNGQSWGKKIMKIKVIKTDGTNTTFSSYFLRWITSLLEVFALLGSLALITIIINRKGQRLGDIAANTAVIRLREKNFKTTIFTEVPSDYTVVHPEAGKLSINDLYTIQEVLKILKSYDTDVDKKAMAQKARIAVEKKLNITSEQKSMQFFETLIRDYNFINSRN